MQLCENCAYMRADPSLRHITTVLTRLDERLQSIETRLKDVCEAVEQWINDDDDGWLVGGNAFQDDDDGESSSDEDSTDMGETEEPGLLALIIQNTSV